MCMGERAARLLPQHRHQQPDLSVLFTSLAPLGVAHMRQPGVRVGSVRHLLQHVSALWMGSLTGSRSAYLLNRRRSASRSMPSNSAACV